MMLRKYSKLYNYLLYKTLLFIFFTIFGNEVKGYKVGNDPFHRAAYLDQKQNYHLEWFVNQNTSRITFSLKVQTSGWILFGLAKNAGDPEQDFVIGGVLQNGKPYFSDRHSNPSSFNGSHQKDTSQDYDLESFWEKRGCTFLTFSRKLDTCDHKDYRITENKLTLIWAYGKDDILNGNFNSISNYINQGSYDVYLLDPEYTPSPEDIQSDHSIQTWTISSFLRIPSSETSYLCTIRKAPRLRGKHHIIGYNVKFDNDQSRDSTHHLDIRRCRAPKGMSSNYLFEPFSTSGEYQSCYSFVIATGPLSSHFCTQFYFAWAIGGREFFLPDHVGIPFNDDSSEDEYYMVQAHYTNPHQSTNIVVDLQIEVFYTQNLRKNDGGLILITNDLPGLPESLLIPPKTPEIQIYSQCSGECTQRMLPKEGITFVGGLLHSHNSGKKVKLHHFRGNKELPWILYDDNYDNQFQQDRGLPRREVVVLPGDQLVMDCTYDNTWTNGTVVSGFRTSQEMCMTFMFFYSSLPEYSSCRSGINSPYLRERFLGVRNITWQESQLDWVVNVPSPWRLVGRTITDISDNFVEWTRERRDELQNVYHKFPQVGDCARDLFSRDLVDIENFLRDNAQTDELIIRSYMPTNVNTKDEFIGPVEYPNGVKHYSLSETDCVH